MIRFARCRRPEGERAPNRFWYQVSVSSLKRMMLRLLSANSVEGVCERDRACYADCVFANTEGMGGKRAYEAVLMTGLRPQGSSRCPIRALDTRCSLGSIHGPNLGQQ